MSFSKNPMSFDDVRGALDKALASPNGVRISCESPGKATYIIQRMNAFRISNAKANAGIYPPEHVLHGNSVYYRLTIRKVGSEILIEKKTEDSLKVENL